MKKFFLCLLCLYFSFLCVGCNYIMKVDPTIYVSKCEHGSIKVSFYDEIQKGCLISAYPDTGYELKKENLHVFYKDTHYYNSKTSKYVEELKENQFFFICNDEDDLIVTALFTKKTAAGETL